jgi:hypothetical protein
MSRKKRPRHRVMVGPHMREIAAHSTESLIGQSTDKAALFKELAHTLARATRSAENTESESNTAEQPLDHTAELIQLLADVATGLWRLRSKMLTPRAEPLLEEHYRRSYKQLESIFDILNQAGVQIRDHTAEAVPRGGIYTLKALAYEPTPGLSREEVIETLKPTIVFKDRVIQTGEVIIGTPTEHS